MTEVVPHAWAGQRAHGAARAKTAPPDEKPPPFVPRKTGVRSGGTKRVSVYDPVTGRKPSLTIRKRR